MLIDEVLKDSRARMQDALENIGVELAKLRVGKATLPLLDGVKIPYFGSKVPLNQVANISIPESRLLVIQPWDRKMIQPIEKAILASDLGLNPSSDGAVIRLVIPQLTEERRKNLIKLIRKFGEEGRIHIRILRMEANETLKKAERDGDISKEESFHGQKEVQKITDEFIEKIGEMEKSKEEETMQV
jgi:ribosome recycling factor